MTKKERSKLVRMASERIGERDQYSCMALDRISREFQSPIRGDYKMFYGWFDNYSKYNHPSAVRNQESRLFALALFDIAYDDVLGVV